MKFISRSVSGGGSAGDECAAAHRNGAVSYESVIATNSEAMPGVTFVIQRISFGRRMELTRRIRELSQKAEFLQASGELREKIEANLLAQEIDSIYLHWGLVSVEGLVIDGQAATIDQLLERGPEALVREVLGAIKAQCGLSNDERKN